MADFRTHLIVGTAASGIGAGALLSIGLLSAAHAPACFALGAIGALLPDVDLDHSIPARVAFSLVALAGAFALVLALAPRWSLAELTLAGAAAWVVLRHGVFGTINRWTVHRGLVHSLPAA
ncbi:MAG TPA: metal-dependent hydrolase, partial [Plasticicumulans sp.]|nr:metal-dependent hydrolase [Plasticicumulans sp.]